MQTPGGALPLHISLYYRVAKAGSQHHSYVLTASQSQTEQLMTGLQHISDVARWLYGCWPLSRHAYSKVHDHSKSHFFSQYHAHHFAVSLVM